VSLIEMPRPLALGTKVPGYGTVRAVRSDGERYYFLVDAHGTVSFMPSEIIELLAASEPSTRGGDEIAGNKELPPPKEGVETK
jgi:hypothetical protein